MPDRRAFLLTAAGFAAAAAAACSRPPEQAAPAPTTTSPPPTSTTSTGSGSSTSQTPSPAPAPAPEPPTPEEMAAQRVPGELRDRIASLMHVGVRNFDDALAKLQAGAGGIFITSWADQRILSEPHRNLHDLRHLIGRPFNVSVDFEGGRVQRHANVLGNFPSPRHMADTMDLAGVTAQGFAIGQTLRHHGINVNFAPVLDVDAAGLQVVGDRSFSTDPHQAGQYGAAFARGLIDAGVAPVYKHFPGHGQASGDTHEVAAVTPPLADVIAHDLPPFAHALSQTPAGVMMGHMIVPGLGDGVTPSTLNSAAYELLRQGTYPGGTAHHDLVYTDDLTGMRAITDRLALPDAVAAAVTAGADQALWSSGEGQIAAIDAVERSVHEGRLPVERVDSAAFTLQLNLVNQGL